jgi:hypothetical protein
VTASRTREAAVRQAQSLSDVDHDNNDHEEAMIR